MVSESGAETGASTRLRHDDPDYIDACMFLVDETELLDDFELTSWLSLLDPEVTYVMPVQVTRARQDAQAEHRVSYLFQENYGSLALRATRLMESDSAWSESPPSRYRRYVSNIRVRRSDEGHLHVRSSQLLLRSRGDRPDFDTLSAKREDVLVRDADGELKLRSREIMIDQSRLGVRNLPVPF
jgi:3-phenylpropionate/cinnamic acid dioxygenase small subunit